MKKVILSIFAAASLILFVSVPAFAYDPFEEPCSAGSSSDFCKNATQQATEDRIVGPNGILTKITQFVVYLTGGISVVMIVVGGFKYVISAGDSNGVKSAKDTILYASIGLAVAILSQAIVTYVLSKL